VSCGDDADDFLFLAAVSVNYSKNHRSVEKRPDRVPALLTGFEAIKLEKLIGIVEDEFRGFE
jgi:hypothetical protein